MKFAHLADCHIGGWRDPKLRDISAKALSKAVSICIEKNVDFVLISGDLFNTSLPSIDSLKSVVAELKKLKDKGIRVYMIAGSHDFSPSGKTMLDVLEGAGLAVNVVKGSIEGNKLRLRFTVDKKTGAKITGMIGKKGMLEKGFYESLDRENLESESGYKIFMFHTALTEFKPKDMKDMDSAPLSLLPKGFDYYAGGHVHYVFETEEKGYGKIVFPGPLFPNNFRELENLERGGFYIVEGKSAEWHPLQILNTFHISVNCNMKSPEEISSEIKKEIMNKEFIDTIVTIRLYGKMSSGKISDINLKEIFDILYEKSAYFVMKNTNKLVSEEFEEVKINSLSSDELESELIKEHAGQISCPMISRDDETEITKQLMRVLESERHEGERVYEFEERIKKDVDKIINDIN